MPANKKPRRAYRPKPVVKPLGMRDNWKIVGSAHAALLALGSGSYDDVHQHRLVAFADICRRCAKPGSPEFIQARSLLSTLLDVQVRHNASGAPHHVTALEEVSIRTACSVLIPWAEHVPNMDILRASAASLREFDKLGGIRL